MKTINTFFIAGLSMLYSCSILAAPTHLGMHPSRHVALTLASDPDTVCTNKRSFFRLDADGVEASTVYKVPDDMYLIVTDVVWNAEPLPTAFTQGRVVNMFLHVYDTNGTYKGTPFRAAPQLVTSEHGTVIGDSEHLTAGVRIGPNNHLCAYVLSKSSNVSAVNTVSHAIVYGYHVRK